MDVAGATVAAVTATAAGASGGGGARYLFDGLGRQIEDLIHHRPELADGRDDGDRDERAKQAVLDRCRAGPVAAQRSQVIETIYMQ